MNGLWHPDAGVQNILYGVACVLMLVAAIFEFHDNKRTVTWPLLVSLSWATVMFIWWRQ